MRALIRWLYRLARLGRDAEVLASGVVAAVEEGMNQKWP